MCLGAQLLAHSTGGIVEPLKQKLSLRHKPEVGWGKINFIDSIYNNSVRHNFPKTLDVLHWHADRINLPDNAALIASSDNCKEQIFSIGDKAIGLQCHIESTDKMTSRWIEEDLDFIKLAKGINGAKIIRNQQEVFGIASESSRLIEIKNLFKFLLD